MRDIILFSDVELTAEEYEVSLTETVPNCVKNGENGFMIKKPHTLFIDFSGDKMLKLPPDEYSAEEIEKLTDYFQGKEMYLSDIGYHRSIDVKRVIAVLLTKHPRLYIIDDSETEWIGSAEDYLKADFPY